MTDRVQLRSWSGLAAIAVIAGCSRSPARFYPPKYDSKTLGEQAVAKLDANGDHLLDSKELAASPALSADLKKLDKNGDDQLSAEEIGAKVEEWTAGKLGAVSIVCSVTRGGPDASNIQVKFVPESYMGDVVKMGTGVTNSQGSTAITAEGEKRKSTMHCGYYRVEISSIQNGKETVPAKYNVNSVLGAEVRPKLEVPFVFDISK